MLSGFNGLRGLAAFIVVYYHLNQRMPLEGASSLIFDWHQFVGHGAVMVSLFFMLSGFFRSMSYWKVMDTPHALPAFWPSLKERFLRIAPAYYMAIILSVLVSYWVRGAESLDWRAILTGFTFFSWLTPETLFPVLLNGPLWFIAFDMMGWIFTSLFMIGLMRLPQQKWLLYSIGVVVVTLVLHVAWTHLPFWQGRPTIFGWFPTYNPFLFFLHFLFGIAAAYGVTRLSRAGTVPHVRYDVLTIASILTILVTIWILRGQSDWLSGFTGPYHFPWLTSLFAIVFICLPFTLWLGRYLDNPFLLFTGKISYSLYLIHGLWVVVLGDVVFGKLSIPSWILYSLAVIVLSYLIAWLMLTYIEIPFGPKKEKSPTRK